MVSLEELLKEQQQTNQILDSQLTKTANLLNHLRGEDHLRGEVQVKTLEGSDKKTSEGVIGGLIDSQSLTKSFLVIHGAQLQELYSLLLIPRDTTEG